jgi:hypothetical protein
MSKFPIGPVWFRDNAAGLWQAGVAELTGRTVPMDGEGPESEEYIVRSIEEERSYLLPAFVRPRADGEPRPDWSDWRGTVTPLPDERRSIPLSPLEWAILEEIAAATNSIAERGSNAGEPSWRALLRRIANGELKVLE